MKKVSLQRAQRSLIVGSMAVFLLFTATPAHSQPENYEFNDKIDGVGAGFVVPLWQKDLADQIELVSTEEALGMAMRLAREEGLFSGTSTGANVIAAMRLAEQVGPDATIVTVMCDTGMKYFKTFGANVRGENERRS